MPWDGPISSRRLRLACVCRACSELEHVDEDEPEDIERRRRKKQG
jgi:hypothetical protein